MGESLGQLIQSMWQSGSVLIYFPAFLAGLLVSVSPCVYPVLPVAVSVVTANARGRVLRAFGLSITYAVGIALVYSALGVAAALTKTVFGSWVSNPYLLFVVANLFVVMGLSMLGAFELPIPGFFTQQRGSGFGSFAATLLAGLASALIVGPCSGPVLGAMLALIAAAGESASPVRGALFGGSIMFAFAMGMSSLMIAAATLSGFLTALPRPGRWMSGVTKAFGVIMILMGEFFIFLLGLTVPIEDYPLIGRLLSLVGK